MRNWSSSERGALLVLLLPVTCLALLFLVGSVRWAYRAQQKVALQARLDVCAVSLALVRSRLATELKSTNAVLRASAAAITAVRAGRLLTGPLGQVAAAMGLETLLRVNQAAGRWQSLQIALAQARETAGWLCAANEFSRELGYCRTQPPLARAVRREKGIFPDVIQPAFFSGDGNPLARVRCRSGDRETALRVEGDPLLTYGSYVDRYEK